MAVVLRLKRKLKAPANAECISPNTFAGKSINEIAKLQFWHGNRRSSLKDIFEIKGNCGKTPNEVTIQLIGQLTKVRGLGTGMTDGEIAAKGNVGMHLGEEMKGGKITVEGSVGSWAGSSMRSGTIEVKGDAGDYIGGAYRGSTKGMRGGSIIIHGNAGTEVGCYMRKGLIKVYGDIDQFAGIHMRDGTMVVYGKAKERAGAYMTGGKIILCDHIPSVLPTFTINNIKSKAKAEEEKIKGPFYVFIGDLAENGKGKLYVAKDKNEHLKGCEELL